MPGRNGIDDPQDPDGHRYGFNGMELDQEVKPHPSGLPNGNSYDFGARMYDPRVGRWLTVDPLDVKYPDLTPYAFVANSPMLFVDSDGRKFVNPYKSKIPAAKTNVMNAEKIFNELKANHSGKLKNRDIKDYANQSGLTSAQNELKTLSNKSQLVDDLIYTLKAINPSEYNYFETLTDGNGKSVDLVINLKNAQSTSSGQTNNFAIASSPGSNKVFVTQNTGGIQISLFKGTARTKDGGIAIVKGQTFATLANELGDVKYAFTKVKTKADVNFWTETGPSDNNPYDKKGYEDPNGAGVYSFDYEEDRVKELKNYVKTNLQSNESYNIDNQTIEKR